MTGIVGSTFNKCNSLQSVVIPDTVTSIAASAFNSSYSLQNITIPSLLDTIGNNAFQDCYGLAWIRFEPYVPPTVSSSYTFANMPTDCVIYVPAASLDAYKTATNYPSPSTYTYIGY